MDLQGKGFFLWQIKRISGGDATAIADVAKQAGLSHVLIKIADGKYNYNVVNGVDLVAPLVDQLRARGISPWGWQYVYGSSPKAEADKAVARVRMFNLDGFVVNAEKEFKAPGMSVVAEKYMKQLRLGLPDLQVGLSTYRYPSIHYQFPFSTFLKYCDFSMPQVYWVQSSNPAQQLQKSVTQYKLLQPVRPIFPTGSAYPEGSWSPTPDQLIAFMQAARELGLPGANFWEWYYAVDKGGALWSTVQNFNWSSGAPAAPPVASEPEPIPEPLSDIGERYIRALNSGDPAKVTRLYEKKSGKLVNGKRKLQGRMAIYAWHNALQHKMLPQAKYKLLDFVRDGEFYKLKWSAQSKSAKVEKGKDLIRLSVDQPQLINYHFTDFKVQKA